MLSVTAFVLLVQVCSGELSLPLPLHWLSVWHLFILREICAHSSFFPLFGSPAVTSLTPFFKSPDVFLHPLNYSRGMHHLPGIMCFGFPVLYVGLHALFHFLFTSEITEKQFTDNKGKGACLYFEYFYPWEIFHML